MSVDNAATSTSSAAAEQHLIYVLLDSNLPTGGFVSSSGLESYTKHGFLTSRQTYVDPWGSNIYSSQDSTSSGLSGPVPPPTKIRPPEGIMNFSAAELDNYASTTLPFVADAWRAVYFALNPLPNPLGVGASDGNIEQQAEISIAKAIQVIELLDQYHESNLLSHVSRRSSKAQGIAMLTLYTRGLSSPEPVVEGEHQGIRPLIADGVVEEYKRLVRKGTLPGHLSVCWGVITASLGISLERALHLHLFLHARSLLSSSVRLNVVGPYASSQLLLHPMRTLIEHTITRYPSPTTGILDVHQQGENQGVSSGGDDFWEWTEKEGPATTWPLGEILMSRHDLQHSRIFNS